MNSSNLDPYLVHSSFDPLESLSPSDGISIRSAAFAGHIRVTHTQTDTLRVISVAMCRTYAMHGIQRKNSRETGSNR